MQKFITKLKKYLQKYFHKILIITITAAILLKLLETNFKYAILGIVILGLVLHEIQKQRKARLKKDICRSINENLLQIIKHFNSIEINLAQYFITHEICLNQTRCNTLIDMFDIYLMSIESHLSAFETVLVNSAQCPMVKRNILNQKIIGTISDYVRSLKLHIPLFKNYCHSACPENITYLTNIRKSITEITKLFTEIIDLKRRGDFYNE